MPHHAANITDAATALGCEISPVSGLAYQWDVYHYGSRIGTVHFSGSAWSARREGFSTHHRAPGVALLALLQTHYTPPKEAALCLPTTTKPASTSPAIRVLKVEPEPFPLPDHRDLRSLPAHTAPTRRTSKRSKS